MDRNIKPAFDSPSSVYRSRIPLANKSNITSNFARQRSPPNIRWDHKDSSEGEPSSHSSVYDAVYVSDSSDAAKSPYQTPAPSLVPAPTPGLKVTRPATPPPQRSTTSIDLNSESPLSRLEAFETPFLYGHGTELAPIAEQRSIATLRSTCSNTLSTSDISSLLKHKESGTSSSRSKNSESPLRRPLRRQHSFSMDDISPLLANDNDKKSTKRRENSEPASSGTTSGSVSIGVAEVGIVRIPRLRNTSKRHSPPTVETVDIHAYPQKPTYPPHQEPAPPFEFTDWMAAHEHSAYPGPRQTYTYPETAFRGIRSGHGNLETHPYMRRHTIGASGPVREPGPFCDLENALGYVPGIGGEREPECRHTRAAPNTGPYAPYASIQYRPITPKPPRMCIACGRPAAQEWSMVSTLIGQGEGIRRGDEWCTRCACRKMFYTWCCCEPLMMHELA
ncbi:hypothetical protein F5Y04DRAFT_149961 [Hypomontagnella monticulosa]|nr:hypothetical protein F5Y04DRAFT_149961 [Hypomontagnella monticulosa]